MLLAALFDSGLVALSVGMPISWPLRFTSAPPLLPGLMGALVWISPVRSPAGPLGASLAERLSALTMPKVAVLRRPSGEPMAMLNSPTVSFDESPNAMGVRLVALILMTARS